MQWNEGYGERLQGGQSDAAVGVGHGFVASVVEVLLAGTTDAQGEEGSLLLARIVL